MSRERVQGEGAEQAKRFKSSDGASVGIRDSPPLWLAPLTAPQ